MAAWWRQMRHHLQGMRGFQLGHALHHTLADSRAEILQDGLLAIKKFLRSSVVIENQHYLPHGKNQYHDMILFFTTHVKVFSLFTCLRLQPSKSARQGVLR